MSGNADNTSMHFKPLNELKVELGELGYSVRQWSAKAGLPWQRVYTKLANERTLRIFEYEQLLNAYEQIKGEVRGTKRQET